MSKIRLTRQGVRALDPIGHNGHRSTRTRCLHNFAGQRVVIGTRWVIDADDYQAHQEPIYGRPCLFGCGETKLDA